MLFGILQMMLCHAPINASVTPEQPKCSLNPSRERDAYKRYIYMYKRYIPLGNFGTNLSNLFIRLYHNFPFHSLPQHYNLHPNFAHEFTSSDPSRRLLVTSQSRASQRFCIVGIGYPPGRGSVTVIRTPRPSLYQKAPAAPSCRHLARPPHWMSL